MKKLWRFTDKLGSFESNAADKISSLYLPLANEHIMSSITPDLGGDIKSGQDSFLLEPVSRIGLSSSKCSRNFWVYIDKNKIWSIKTAKGDKFKLEAGLLWQKVTRETKALGLRVETLNFVPSGDLPVELMQVRLTNISRKKIKLIPTAAIPIYARSADNIRDHRHVTSLLQRITLDRFGVIVKPTLTFNENGHKPNKDNYFVLGWDEAGRPPRYIYPTQEMFCGEGGNLEAPESILENLPPREGNIQGKESMGALRFSEVTLAPGKSRSFIIAMGITQDAKQIGRIRNKFKNPAQVEISLELTKKHWFDLSNQISSSTGGTDFDNWFKWVSIQPVLRRIFGCSFLPDFDYGRGGRGWRDLWQDCLGLILSQPRKVRRILLNNFSGVRFDGSNATIIGKKSGEFIADRNDIARVWMDHGVWPLLTTELYMDRSGDKNILFQKAGYFQDAHIWRSSKINRNFRRSNYKGTVFEHLLLENLAQFFNVGAHNHIRLEGADWNDGLDMAKEAGESVAFSCMYASNLKKLAQFLQGSGRRKLDLFAEIKTLLNPCGYDNIGAKQRRLKEFFAKVQDGISGKVISVDCAWLIKDLESKADWMMRNIRRREWSSEGFFNGYYDNKKKRVEGRARGRLNLMLASQVFAIMSGVAEDRQVKKIIANVDKYLFDKKLKGYRLNTDFASLQPDLGRAFSFVYGEKENGSVFSHMVVMYAYALFSRGFHKEGRKALNSLYDLAIDSGKSKIYPCLPEYFNNEGQGMYPYLTGSASWFVLTLLTQSPDLSPH
ncbi:MAG: cellobiose phosphorylase [Candidatus Omnitrophica bacterium]|nr:cellobiose phosphorylase [Candidatus Omnitrophota bacterium]